MGAHVLLRGRRDGREVLGRRWREWGTYLVFIIGRGTRLSYDSGVRDLRI